MSKLSLIAAMALGGLVVCSTLATAQDSTNAPDRKGGKGRMTVDQMMERYTEQLSLTDAQKPKVKALLEDSTKQRRELFRDSSLDQEQKRAKFREVMDAQNTKMKGILTPDQFTKYQEMNEKMKKGKKKAE
jgi:Spy/CpxP family protein refolding chaperone